MTTIHVTATQLNDDRYHVVGDDGRDYGVVAAREIDRAVQKANGADINLTVICKRIPHSNNL
ncbi:hypothetical protein [Dyella nitratireducens]|uniref:Translation initiation factor IF-3 n=1 Tax=Dyella nitratireducens TaxID=1849580 RepID=A0ABQ1GC40_9GAMM|nr:hypothetical protein [Dyella nitratireducens]GGA40850.1 hypothetical protein GCM10010981_32590 [Dyella nitratireducens]GLQ40617.1 hypothetical protein GCM10007902_04660 [Dyella nitratireducens]